MKSTNDFRYVTVFFGMLAAVGCMESGSREGENVGTAEGQIIAACLDNDNDEICNTDDNCPNDSNGDQADADGDGVGDACEESEEEPCADLDYDGICDGDEEEPCSDSDNDGVCYEDDKCPGTVSDSEAGVPSVHLVVNRWALVEVNPGEFLWKTKHPQGMGPKFSPTIEDTAGCSCAQIIEALDLGEGHKKHGCSKSALQDWIEYVSK